MVDDAAARKQAEAERARRDEQARVDEARRVLRDLDAQMRATGAVIDWGNDAP